MMKSAKIIAFVTFILLFISVHAFATFYTFWSAPVTVKIKGFKLSAFPPSQTVLRGENAIYTITVSSINGFNQAVELAVIAMPTVSATINPAIVTPPSDGSINCTLIVSVATTTFIGDYSLIITGKSGTLIHSESIYLTVIAMQPYHIEIYPTDFTIKPGESIELMATLKDAYGLPVGGKIIGWAAGGNPLFSGVLKSNSLTTNQAGESFATFTAGEVPCEISVKIIAFFYEDEKEILASSTGKVLPTPPLTWMLIISGVCFILLFIAHKKWAGGKVLQRTFAAIIIFIFSFTLAYPLGFSSKLSSLILAIKVPSWFLAGLLFLSLMAILISILEQSVKWAFMFGACCWIGVIVGLVLPRPESYMATAGLEAILRALSDTIMEGLIYIGTLALLVQISQRIVRKRPPPSPLLQPQAREPTSTITPVPPEGHLQKRTTSQKISKYPIQSTHDLAIVHNDQIIIIGNKYYQHPLRHILRDVYHVLQFNAVLGFDGVYLKEVSLDEQPSSLLKNKIHTLYVV